MHITFPPDPPGTRYVEVPAWVLEEIGVDAFMVYAAHLTLVQLEGNESPSITDIAAKTEDSARTVKKAIRALEKGRCSAPAGGSAGPRMTPRRKSRPGGYDTTGTDNQVAQRPRASSSLIAAGDNLDRSAGPGVVGS